MLQSARRRVYMKQLTNISTCTMKHGRAKYIYDYNTDGVYMEEYRQKSVH